MIRQAGFMYKGYLGKNPLPGYMSLDQAIVSMALGSQYYTNKEDAIELIKEIQSSLISCASKEWSKAISPVMKTLLRNNNLIDHKNRIWPGTAMVIFYANRFLITESINRDEGEHTCSLIKTGDLQAVAENLVDQYLDVKPQLLLGLSTLYVGTIFAVGKYHVGYCVTRSCKLSGDYNELIIVFDENFQEITSFKMSKPKLEHQLKEKLHYGLID